MSDQIVIYYLCGVDPYVYRDLKNDTYWAQNPESSNSLTEYKERGCINPTGRVGRPYYASGDYSYIMLTYK